MPPIIVIELFPELLDSLLAVLTNLSSKEWERPTSAPLWSVKDVALHLLGGDVGILSRKRDKYSFPSGAATNWDDLVSLINHLNEVWVTATRRISPQLLCELLRVTGEKVNDYFMTLDPYSIGGPVDWAGPDPAPVWLDLAREYTERWHHQQQIREAVGIRILNQPKYLAPVLDTFMRALPHTYRDVSAADGTTIAFTLSGASGGTWFLIRTGGRWDLRNQAVESGESAEEPLAEIALPVDIAWRLFTRGVTSEAAQAKASIRGNRYLALKLLEMVCVIAETSNTADRKSVVR